MLFMQFALLLDFLEEYKKYFQPEITYRATTYLDYCFNKTNYNKIYI